MRLVKRATLIAAITACSAGLAGADEDGMEAPNMTLEALHAAALEQGLVRVIVELAAADAALDVSAEAQLEIAKIRVQSALPMDDAPVVEPLEDQPFIVMEVTSRGLEWLENSDLIGQIVPDTAVGIPPVMPTPGDDNPTPNVGGTDDFAAPQDDS